MMSHIYNLMCEKYESIGTYAKNKHFFNIILEQYEKNGDEQLYKNRFLIYFNQILFFLL